MIESLVPAASTYAWEIDALFELVFWLVGFWFIACEVDLWFKGSAIGVAEEIREPRAEHHRNVLI